MDTGRVTAEQLEIPFPPTTRDRLARRVRPWGLRQLALEVGVSARSIYRHRDEGLLKVVEITAPGRKRRTFRVEAGEAIRYYDDVFKEFDPNE